MATPYLPRFIASLHFKHRLDSVASGGFLTRYGTGCFLKMGFLKVSDVSVSRPLKWDPSWIPASHFCILVASKRPLMRRKTRRRRSWRRSVSVPLKPRLDVLDRFAMVAALRRQYTLAGDFGHLEPEIERTLSFGSFDKVFWRAASYHLSQKVLNALVHALNGNIFVWFASFFFNLLLPVRVARAVYLIRLLGFMATSTFLFMHLYDLDLPVPPWILTFDAEWFQVLRAHVMTVPFLLEFLWLDRTGNFATMIRSTRVGMILARFIVRRFPRINHAVDGYWVLWIQWFYHIVHSFFILSSVFMIYFLAMWIPTSFYLLVSSAYFAFLLVIIEIVIFYFILIILVSTLDDLTFTGLRMNVRIFELTAGMGELLVRMDPDFFFVFGRYFGWAATLAGYPLLIGGTIAAHPLNVVRGIIMAFRLPGDTPVHLMMNSLHHSGVNGFYRSILTPFIILRWMMNDENALIGDLAPLLATWFYPLSLLIMVYHHMIETPWFDPERHDTRRVWARTLTVRVTFTALTPVLALTAITNYLYLFVVASFVLTFVMGSSLVPLLGLKAMMNVLMLNLWPLLTALWCQVAPVRGFFNAFDDSEFIVDYNGDGDFLDTPLGSFIYLFQRFYVSMYLFACGAGFTARPVAVIYTINNQERILGVRSNIPDDRLEVLAIFRALFNKSNPNGQHFRLGLLFPILGLWLLKSFLVSFYSYNLRMAGLYVSRVLKLLLFIWLLPEPLLVIAVGLVSKYSLYFKAWADNYAQLDQFIDSAVYFARRLGIAAFFALAPDAEELVGAPLAQTFVGPAKLRYLARIRVTAIRVSRFLDDFKLPEFVMAQWQAPTVSSVKHTYETLRDLGWPVEQEFIDSINLPSDDAYLAANASLATRVVASTNFVFGILRRAVGSPPEMDNWVAPGTIFADIQGYFHTSVYTDSEAEMVSTSRYWTGNNPDPLPETEVRALIDDVWMLVKAQFANSRLASPAYIYDRWEKKFNLGFGFYKKGRDGRMRQLARREAINRVGGKRAFLDLWQSVFTIAGTLTPIAPVFTKMETLKPKKALAKAVRTVVGSAITHHIMTTVFNYLPNHNYSIWETPMKVGLSFNGQSFGRLWETLLRHEFVWAGDMTAFDSTIPEPILRLAAEIRKKGFSTHGDYHRICQLIDIAYDQLLEHPLGFKSTGRVYTKAQGFTTGHSSTSPDNSLAIVICYMFAWRRITMMGAREFLNHNTLHNFGDDHVLGWDDVFGWSPEAAARVFKEMGIIMRDEAEKEVHLPGNMPSESALRRRFTIIKPHGSPADFDAWFASLSEAQTFIRSRSLAFLAKMPVEKVGKVAEDIDRANVTVPFRYGTLHNKERLIGKIKGEIFLNTDPFIRRERLISYMGLCAHHEDVYDSLLVSVQNLETRFGDLWARQGRRQRSTPTPSYVQVVRKWYNPTVHVKVTDLTAAGRMPEEDHEMLDEMILSLTSPSVVDLLVRWVADVPTVLNPRVVSTTWSTWLQRAHPVSFSWPFALIAYSNALRPATDSVRDLLLATPYNFLVDPKLWQVVNPTNPASLLVRHWIYMWADNAFMTPKKQNPSLFHLPKIIDTAICNIQFFMNGRVSLVVEDFRIDFFKTVLVLLLNYLLVPDWLDAYALLIFKFQIPTVSWTLSVLWWSFKRTINPLGSVDVQPFFAVVHRAIETSSGFVVSAPTGVGKSTTLMASLAREGLRKIVVVEPRALVAHRLVSWMRHINPDLSIGEYVEGGIRSPQDTLIYGTVQSIASSALLGNPGNILVVLDEAHIYEPHYIAFKAWLEQANVAYILLTATPHSDWPEEIVVVPSNPRFSVVEFEHESPTMGSYLREARKLAEATLPYQKILIFVPSIRLGESLARTLRGGTSTLVNSKTAKTFDTDARYFIATSVADAGLTLPDVTMVISSDLDVTLSTDLVQTEIAGDTVDQYKRTPLWFRINHNTVRQRRGRTGRTADGTFHFYRVPHQKNVSLLHYTRQDYIDNLGPALSILERFIPGYDVTRLDRVNRSSAGLSWYHKYVSTFSGLLEDAADSVRVVAAYDTKGVEEASGLDEFVYLSAEELPSLEVAENNDWVVNPKLDDTKSYHVMTPQMIRDRRFRMIPRYSEAMAAPFGGRQKCFEFLTNIGLDPLQWSIECVFFPKSLLSAYTPEKLTIAMRSPTNSVKVKNILARDYALVVTHQTKAIPEWILCPQDQLIEKSVPRPPPDPQPFVFTGRGRPGDRVKPGEPTLTSLAEAMVININDMNLIHAVFGVSTVTFLTIARSHPGHEVFSTPLIQTLAAHREEGVKTYFARSFPELIQ